MKQRTVNLALSACLLALGCGESRIALTLGIPTTVQDSGLLDVLLPEFELAHPTYRLVYVAAGSGELLALGARGDLDVLVAHAPTAELEFMEKGHGLTRRPLMENDFVIVGPQSDPAGIRAMPDAAAALARIAEAGASFLSRGDDSGTHVKELSLRQAAGIPAGGAEYREMGQGMGAVLRAAADLDAYALSDRATFLNLSATLDLEVLVESDPRLRNVYSVIRVAGARELDGALAFADWLTSAAGRKIIAAYGVERFGVALYRPAEAEEERGSG